MLNTGLGLITQFGSYGTGNGQFQYPYGIVAYSNAIFVQDATGRAQWFNTSYSYVSTIQTGGLTAIAFDPSDGSIYVGTNAKLRKVNSSGSLLWEISASSPSSIVIDVDGSVYFTESSSPVIRGVKPYNGANLSGRYSSYYGNVRGLLFSPDATKTNLYAATYSANGIDILD